MYVCFYVFAQRAHEAAIQFLVNTEQILPIHVCTDNDGGEGCSRRVRRLSAHCSGLAAHKLCLLSHRTNFVAAAQRTSAKEDAALFVSYDLPVFISISPKKTRGWLRVYCRLNSRIVVLFRKKGGFVS